VKAGFVHDIDPVIGSIGGVVLVRAVVAVEHEPAGDDPSRVVHREGFAGPEIGGDRLLGAGVRAATSGRARGVSLRPTPYHETEAEAIVTGEAGPCVCPMQST
jgi:hypothetical protein